MKNTGWTSQEPNVYEKYDLIKKKIEEVKNSQPSRELVQEQIDNIFITKGSGIIQYNRIITALQALLELVESNKTDKPESDL